MEIRLAKTAGFCFGVNRAVELTYGLLAEGHKVATLGPLIHNPQAVEDMRRKGAQVVDTVQDVPAGCEVVIRSHGVPRSVYDELEARGIPYHDATCPFVQKIQRIAAEAEKEGAVLLVAGDKTHPEVQGIVGHTRGEVFVFADLAELEAWNGPSDPQKPLFAVAQTTFQVTKWKESSEFLKKAYTNARIFDTICNATWARQQEAEDLSQQCDIIVVIGGHHSSNTQKLVQVAAKHTRAVTVETARFIIPTYLTSLFTTVYTIVDGIFVSAYVGTNALAAINVVYPLVNILYGIALAFATGGSALAALHNGGKKNDEASRTFSISMTAAIVIGALVSALILFRLPVILQMLGATSLLMADCKAYIYWWLFGAPIVVGKEMFTYFIRVDGSPTYSFLTALSGGIFNIVFDYIFIGQLHMGITGAALATFLGLLLSFVMV